jgi:hypothetical protein
MDGRYAFEAFAGMEDLIGPMQEGFTGLGEI